MARVLLVDDEPTILIILSAFFRSEGHEVVTVQGGQKAAYLIKSEKFDLMISDMRMEPLDGTALLKMAKEHCPEMPVIMVTAYFSAEAAESVKKMGAFAYLKKPFNNSELLRISREALEAAAGESNDGVNGQEN